MSEDEIRSTAVVQAARDPEPAGEDLVAAMVAFERRYGGLSYPLIVGNAMRYGLDGDATAYPTDHGTAFGGILDGDWTCVVDVLADGRTLLAPGTWPARVIDRTVDQRLEKHAVLAGVRGWPHRAYESFTPAGEPPRVRELSLPPPAPEASGPADRWWLDDVTAVQVTLRGWSPRQDHWIVRLFGRAAHLLEGEDAILRAAFPAGRLRPVFWCDLCPRHLPGPGRACQPPVA